MALALMILLVMKMRYVLRQRMAERRFPRDVLPQTQLANWIDEPPEASLP